MKKIILIALTSLFVSGIYAQKVKVQNDVVYIDKVEIGTLVGDVGMIKKADYVLKSKNGTVIYTIKEEWLTYKVPVVKDLYWLNIKFGDSGKGLIIYIKNHCATSKCLINKLIDEAEIVPTENGVQNQDQIISKYDKSVQLAKDTVDNKNMIDGLIKLAKTPGIQRDKSKGYTYSDVKSTTTGYMLDYKATINQGGVAIGEIKLKSEKSDMSSEAEYWVMKKFAEPQGTGKTLTETFAAYAKANLMDVELFIFEKDEKIRLKVKDPYNAKDEIIKYLIDNGYL